MGVVILSVLIERSDAVITSRVIYKCVPFGAKVIDYGKCGNFVREVDGNVFEIYVFGRFLVKVANISDKRRKFFVGSYSGGKSVFLYRR